MLADRRAPQQARPPQRTRPARQTGALRTELLMLNIAEASGWVAFVDSEMEQDDTEDYRIVIHRESTGEILFESTIPLARGLRTHGFEMSREDARLLDIAATVDAGILPPLAQLQAGPAETSAVPPAPPAETLTQDSISVLTGVQVVGASDNTITLQMLAENILSIGDRIFLRTPPETMQDEATGEVLILSRGRIAGLLEVTSITDNLATATLKSGAIPSEGYLERVDPDL
jgi:hypothetical protein